uniref:Capsid polyprotein VP90 n=1 Tax=Porcine astrovirus 1 TaxID=1239567 RepID=CAPSD_PASV1|nr:RecName: Full=Capsid polyprotein VP90 [Mamastrovirus 3]BAA90309.1 capsid protein precursor [Mamastrovirus 3]
MASKSGKDVTVKVENTNGRGRSRSRSRSRSRARNKNVKITINSKPGASGGQRRRGKPQSDKRVRSIVKQQLDKSGVTGPKPAIRQRATATLGTIGSNSSGKTELEACILTNPILVKDNTGNNTFGPIVALGAQYSLWRIRFLRIKFTPMVGQSAVTGTVVRASLNPTATPSSTGWSGLGARRHIDIVVGKAATFNLKASDLSGPREGWWLTNTNDSGDSTLGPSIEIHTLGTTMSAYQNGPFTGGLFLCELQAEWEFSGYAANPALLSLEKNRDDDAEVSFDGQQGEPLTMVVAEDSLFNKVATRRSTFTRGIARDGQTKSETIWQVVDTAVSAAETVVPPPFGWLIRGGYWFVKKLAGRTKLRNGKQTSSYVCYASYQDALSDKPAICTGVAANFYAGRTETARANLHFTQMNEPSTGVGETPTAFRMYRAAPDDIVYLRFKPETVNISVSPAARLFLARKYTAHSLKVKGNSGTTRIHCVVKVNDPMWYSPDWEQVAQPGPIPGVSLLGGTTTIGIVTAAYQAHMWGLHIATAFIVQVTKDINPACSTSCVLTKELNDQHLKTVAGQTSFNWSLRAGETYLMMSFGAHTSAVGEWVWNDADISVGYTIYNSPLTPCLLLTEGSFHIVLPAKRGLIPLASTELFTVRDQDSIPQTTEPPAEEDVGDNETEDESDDEDLDHFDLHDSSGSEPEDEDVENNRVTLLNTLVNQGVDLARAAKISKRAYPTLAEKTRRSVFMDSLIAGCGPSSAWSEACKAARKVSFKEPISESRGHAE